MKKTTFFILSLLLMVSSAFSQGLELTDKLPMDPDVITGQLDNGMKYYIRANSLPEKRAEYTLVLHAGSVLEDDDQQGLAHFNEHMAFNGSKNFPKHELIEYLESLGMKFGPEVNAYTSFDETVYGIKVPTDNEEYVDKGLLVLYDWASQLSLETEEIEAERGVIREEWRLGQGAMDRMQRKYLEVLFHNSKYAKRLPIGTMEVVDHCDPDVLRRFYNDWYRPDLMAVVVVGDFDAKVMEQKVIKQFSKIPKRENPRKRELIQVPDHDETLVCVATDPEAPVSLVQIFYKHDQKPTKTVEDYRKNMIMTSLVSSMISKRLAELTLLENPPFAQGYAGYTDFIGPKSVYMSIGVVQNNDSKTTLKTLVKENQRMKQHGFTQTELEREKTSLLKNIEKLYNERNKQESSNYVEEYKSHFLPPHNPCPGISYEYELFKKYLPTITLEEINKFAQEMIIDKNTVIVVMAPEKEGVKVPTQEEVLKIYEETSKEKVEKYVDKVVDKPLLKDVPQKGKISKKIKNKDLDYETWVLDNGVNVVIKSTDFKDDQILFEATSKGGFSQYGIEDNINARFASSIAKESGLGNLDKSELTKYLSDKNVSLNTYISENEEALYGNSSVQDFETLLQMIYATFTAPKFSQSAMNSFVNKQKGMLENQMLDPQSAWKDTLRWTMASCSPYKKPVTPEMLESIDFKRAKYIFKQRFGNPSDFTFYFVGNIDKKVAKELIVKYLGGLPKVNRVENYKDLGIRPPKGVVEKTVNKGNDPKCVEIISYHGKMEYTPKNRIKLDAICKILTTKLLEEIREKESGVYSIGAYPSSSDVPYENYSVSIFFSCDPKREPELAEKIFKIIEEVKQNSIDQEDVDVANQKQIREFETDIKENQYWKTLLIELHEGTKTNDDFNNFNSMVKENTIETMKESANKYFDKNNYVKVRLFPVEGE